MIQRRAIPFVPQLQASGKLNPAQAAAEQLNQLIQKNEAEGWTFSHLDALQTFVNAGCLAALAGHKSQALTIQLAIFEKQA